MACITCVIGVGLEVLSTLSGTAGKQLIRFSELHKRRAPRSAKVTFTLGLIINTIAGPVLDMGAYSFAPQSLIAPFGGLDVIWNAALAPYILKEKLTRSRLAACALIFLGTLSSAAFGSHSEEEYTIEMLEEKLVDWRCIVYFVVFAAWILFNVLVPMRRPKGDIIRGMSLGMTAGTLAGNMFCVKAFVELVETSIRTGDGEIWLHWLPYASLAGAAFFALSNVGFMTRGLLEFEALFMVTIYEGSMVFSNCLSASVILLELNDLEWWRVAGYCLCMALVLAGMFEVTRAEAMKPKVTYDDECPLGEGARGATVVGGPDDDAVVKTKSGESVGSCKSVRSAVVDPGLLTNASPMNLNASDAGDVAGPFTASVLPPGYASALPIAQSPTNDEDGAGLSEIVQDVGQEVGLEEGTGSPASVSAA